MADPAGKSARGSAVVAGRSPVRAARSEAARGSGSGRLPFLILLSLLGLTGMVARDHVLPGFRPADAGAAVVDLDAGAGGGEGTTGPPRGEDVSREDRSPLLSGKAAERALRERQREERLGKLQQHSLEESRPPSL